MVFDVLSFLAGVTAGAIMGLLAATLHSLENTADLQEKLRRVANEVEGIDSTVRGPKGHDIDDYSVKRKVEELRNDLKEIHEEIRRMYKKTTR
jgi:gas vesicle protein